MKKCSAFFVATILIMVSMFLAACQNAAPVATSTPAETASPKFTLAPTLTPAAIFTIAPTPLGGSLIAFERDRDIYVMKLDGSGLTDLTKDLQPPASYAEWSPDGKKIAFVSSPISNNTVFTDFVNIYVMNADGTDMKNLTNRMNSDTQPSWSPDGQRIAFAAQKDNSLEISVMNSDGTNLISLNQAGSEPSWSPDGKRISFTCDTRICIMKSDGSEVKQVTPADILWAQSSAWAPDGKSIAFTDHEKLYIMDADGSNLKKLTDNPGPNWEPGWSPDSKQIVFACNFKICIMNVDGTNVTQLPEDWGRGPSWQP